eukprot:CAMPEP_0198120760 /NCGR_PEP_ID=MMETSP1442-20131203/30222_1 /TAXON_ID= /ORGANISM="Craspedostauros australis, Strain CCMP3328" /LENGTH=117 /DNA_ID=CAMNT_0043779473 /DNA_START=44 /DNA_END=397 /DNA_ORIENTATION=+
MAQLLLHRLDADMQGRLQSLMVQKRRLRRGSSNLVNSRPRVDQQMVSLFGRQWLHSGGIHRTALVLLDAFPPRHMQLRAVACLPLDGDRWTVGDGLGAQYHRVLVDCDGGEMHAARW